MRLEHLFYIAPLKLFKLIATANGEVVYAAQLGREAKVSFAHTSKIIRDLERSGLVECVKEWGKIRIKLKITPLGEQIWKHLDIISGRLENEEAI